jgi:hypothetical protein
MRLHKRNELSRLCVHACTYAHTHARVALTSSDRDRSSFVTDDDVDVRVRAPARVERRKDARLSLQVAS